MAMKQLSYCFCAHSAVFRARPPPGFLYPHSQWESDAENASGGRRESTVAIRTRYLSLDFFPVVNAPLLGASQCVCTSKTGPPSLKGKTEKTELVETQCSLYHLRTPALHWQLRNTTTYNRCHAMKKRQTLEMTADILPARLNSITVKICTSSALRKSYMNTMQYRTRYYPNINCGCYNRVKTETPPASGRR